jgi:selenocysteine lyase/cysteine desulfurase
MNQDRKQFLKHIGTGLLATSLPAIATAATNNLPMIDPKDFSGDGSPDDEKFWKRIAKKYYDVEDDYINLENGYYGIQPKPILKSYLQHIDFVNENAARFARKDFPAINTAVKKELAAFLEVSDEEIIITRNATEALNIAIQGYPFQAGDEVLINQLDYFSMIEAFRMLEKRGRIKVNAFEMPLLPASEDEIVEIYSRQITPKTKVIRSPMFPISMDLLFPWRRYQPWRKQEASMPSPIQLMH